MTGGGKQKGSVSDNSRKYTLTTVCRFIKKQAVPAARCLKKLFEKLSLHSATSGSILIEFAVCMPVLIILLYYINDLSKLKRYYDQTEFVAQQMANILQNIADKRYKEGTTISLLDVKHAAALAYLNIYPETTMYKRKSGHELFHIPRIYLYYVECDSDGKASCSWGAWGNTLSVTKPPWNGDFVTAGSSYGTISWGTAVESSSIYPNLKIESGKQKIILEVQLRWKAKESLNPNGKPASSIREVFKMFAVNPKYQDKGATTYFPAVVIFTPNNGFSRTQPK